MILKNKSHRQFYLLAAIVTLAIIILNSGQVFANQLAQVNQRQVYNLERNIVYEQVNETKLTLDVYKNKKSGLSPTLMVIHGGGWIKGEKEDELFFKPYFDWGFSVVNIEYRLAKVALAPAAVEDALCALNWVVNNASKYNFDTKKIVLTGFSAGGHLSLTTGMMPDVKKFNQNCPESKPTKVAAIVNWSGITDVNDLLIGRNQKYFAVQWFGNRNSPREIEIAKSVSPINFVRPNLPPILTIHGEKDNFVPYSHAVRLHQALRQAGTVNQLFTVKGAEHGGFSKAQKRRIYAAIKTFLIKQGVIRNN
ncbi:alpha/beta hydrolase [Nostoc sp. FACHB-190]|uniref:alpha/beta hydrolase n=1 Tax=Nostoc sp. FACHB-190 TaxID=2692838 RepID=UPI0018F046A1|nr:alpha/beta hydrolase [Nostoc sp. FACHB-190]